MNLRSPVRFLRRSKRGGSGSTGQLAGNTESELSDVMGSQILRGKNALVTGAGRNIGRSIALEMARQGANVYLAEIDRERCAQMEEILAGYGVVSQGFPLDVSRVEEVDGLVESLINRQVGIDVLVNNVGYRSTKRTIGELEPDEWLSSFQANVFGPMHLTRLVSRMMIDRGIKGSIIFITSIHQWCVARNLSYSSAKAALGMIVKELAVDLGPHRIRVNGIAPGWVAEDEGGAPRHQKHTPLGESSVLPRYIGRACVYLASDFFSEYTTGTVIKLDAGLSLFNHRVDQSPSRR